MRKKFLLGVASLCLTTLASAGNVDPSVNPKDGTNVFSVDQKGIIAVKGRILDVRPKPGSIKYVVYATKDEGVTKNDVLELSDFVTSMEERKAGFVDMNPKVCVRKVVDGKILELDDDEEMVFACRNKTIQRVSTVDIKEGGKVDWSAYQLLSKEKLEDVVKKANLEIADFSEKGEFELSEGAIVLKQGTNISYYHDGKTMEFTNSGKGDIVVANGPGFDLKSPMLPKYQKIVQKAIVQSEGRGIIDGDFELIVKVLN